ncbi:hypothetical protein NHQ30_008755 [Ciborinia camelliae]|nr:hypothetical protein NHQ30_008755 [Ciborinia camelliae]
MDTPNTPQLHSAIDRLKLTSPSQIPLPETPTPMTSVDRLREAAQVPLPETPQPKFTGVDRLREAAQVPLPETPPQPKPATFIDRIMAASLPDLQRILIKLGTENEKWENMLQKEFGVPVTAAVHQDGQVASASASDSELVSKDARKTF